MKTRRENGNMQTRTGILVPPIRRVFNGALAVEPGEGRMGNVRISPDFPDDLGVLDLYSPKKAFLDKTWVLPDIEKAE